MRIVIWFFFLLCLFGSLSAFAGSDERTVMNPLSLRPACDTYLRSNCQRKTPTFENALQFCKIRSELHQCDRLANEHPELQDLIASCEPKTFCEQQAGSLVAEARRCLQGGVDGFKELFVVAGDVIEKAWEQARTDLKKRTTFAKACDLSLDCKRSLALKHPLYARMSDKELQGFASLTLMTEIAEKELQEKAQPRGRAFAQSSMEANLKSNLQAASLTTAQESKLKDLWAMAGTTVEEKYHQYGCYTPEAIAELKCYVVGSILDPTLVAGGVLKVTRAQRLLRALVADGRDVLGASFIRRNLYYSPTKPAQNREWMQLAQGTKPGDGVRFFDVENSVMKEMNDTLKNKNLVTSFTNYHKKILQAKTEALFKDLRSSYPELEMVTYSDFKASRFAFKGRGPPDLEERLAKVLEDTNLEFADFLKKEKLIAEGTAAKNWFRAGFGETADQATIASRFSRTQEINSLQSFTSESLQQSLKKTLQSAEGLRTQLGRELANTAVMDNTLHPEAFDIIIKNSKDLPKAQSALKNRFALQELSLSTVEKMRTYANTVDSFSPGIHIAERKVANLDEAVAGGLSADMAGMGSMNRRATAEALLQSSNVQDALAKTRLAEEQVTRQFTVQQETFRNIMKDVVGEHRVKTVCSGDDCVAVPVQSLTETEKQKLLDKISSAGYASKFRLSFIANDIAKVEWRNQLSVHGESIEKLLRKNLSSKMDPNKLSGVIFGVDMRTNKLNEGGVKLMTASHPNVKLSASERKLIEDNFNLALQQMQAGYYAVKP